MASGSFAPIYTAVERELLAQRDRVGYFSLRALAHYADPFGWCYPGLQTLSDLVGYAENSIERKLREFETRGWIRIYETFNDRRRQIERDYQISPEVIWIRDELIEYAWAKWRNPAYILPSAQELKQIVTQKIQPTPITNISYQQTEPTAFNQLQKPAPPPYTAMKNGSSATADLENDGKSKNNGKNGAKQAQAKNSRQAETETKEYPPSSAAPPLPSLENFQTPLPDTDQETIAHILRDEFMTRLPQARRLVSMNDPVLLRAAMEYVRHERRNVRRVRNPMGMVIWWLKEHAITHSDAQHIESQKEDNPYAGMTWADIAHHGDNHDSAN